jgi:hypothetical protein
LRIVKRLVILPPRRIFALPIEWNLPPLYARACATSVYVPGLLKLTGARPVVRSTNTSVDGPAIAPSGPTLAPSA